MRSFTALIDEHHSPPLRYTLGRLLACAATADIAIAHLRLAGLDLTASETGYLRRCRVMVGHFDASALLDAGGPAAGQVLPRLAAFAESGRLELRTAPHHSWNPDFSIFSGLPADGAVALVGAHYFGRPYPRFGTAFTGVFTGVQAVQLCRVRFENLWDAGYDILPVVADTIRDLAADAG
jgi:hypothetical protein